MTLLVLGADKLGNIRENLEMEGVDKIIHWSGRCASCKHKCIPNNVCKIIIFCDFINHMAMGNVKKQAKKMNIPVTYCKRSLSHLYSGG
ncbi:MAG: DUF2325 domain-containing protein [Peptostreptococcaceae bacterium]|nr:DUF2325 domain-containing protein [Peptostreptococcaceae bacterium]